MEESLTVFDEKTDGVTDAGVMSLNDKPEGESKAALYSGLNLAYVGDAVFELYVRTFLIKKGNMPVNRLHKAAVGYVSASAQARMSEAVQPLLNEREKRILKRGENAKPHSISKNADRVEHEKATGFEALIGYLYLKGDEKRLTEIIEAGMRSAEQTSI